jgi:hypothetical protein
VMAAVAAFLDLLDDDGAVARHVVCPLPVRFACRAFLAGSRRLISNVQNAPDRLKQPLGWNP